jgi:hypothetical protein
MRESVVRVMCPNLRCRSILAVPNEARGKMVRCRNCGMNIMVPPKVTAPSAEAEPAKPEKGAKK